jgi:hypothetical protein
MSLFFDLILILFYYDNIIIDKFLTVNKCKEYFYILECKNHVIFDVWSNSAFGHSVFGIFRPFVFRRLVIRRSVIRPFVITPFVIRPFVFRPSVIRPSVIRPPVFRPYVGESGECIRLYQTKA